MVKISKGNKHLAPNWKKGSCPLPVILWEGRVPRLYIGGLFICYLRLLFTFTFFLFFFFFFFFFSNGNDDIDVFWHENNITASSIHWCTLIFSTPPPGFFCFSFLFFVFCFLFFVLFCFVLFCVVLCCFVLFCFVF